MKTLLFPKLLNRFFNQFQKGNPAKKIVKEQNHSYEQASRSLHALLIFQAFCSFFLSIFHLFEKQLKFELTVNGVSLLVLFVAFLSPAPFYVALIAHEVLVPFNAFSFCSRKNLKQRKFLKTLKMIPALIETIEARPFLSWPFYAPVPLAVFADRLRVDVLLWLKSNVHIGLKLKRFELQIFRYEKICDI